MMPKKTGNSTLSKTFTLSDLNDWQKVVDFVLNIEVKVILLNGNLGAGKTTFSKYLVKALGSENPVTSPTFSIVNVYQADERAIYHMDLYRLESYEELFNAGIEEYFYEDGALCIVEWPDLILDTDLVDGAITIDIIELDGKRTVTIGE